MTQNRHDPELRAMYTRRRLLVTAAVATPVAAWWAVRRPGSSGAGPTAATPSTVPVTATPGPTSLPAPAAVVSTTAAPIRLDHDLSFGITDPKVGLMQQRLADLSFDPGPVDDVFGPATLRSVWAFEKLVLGIPRENASGVMTPEAWDLMYTDLTVEPRRRPVGAHLEVYLPEQVAVVFHDGSPKVISHVSSGEGVEWCDVVTIDEDDGTQTEKGICGLSITPGGVYHFERKVEGWRNAKLGRLYKPIYFNYGIAIHGAGNVPDRPASRGCVRFPMHIAEYLQEIVDIGDMVYVFDGVEDPERYGAQPMRFDWPDPNYTTTTTTSTTTSTTTTTTPPAPTTTSAPSTSTSTTPPARSTTTTSRPTTTTSPGSDA